MVDERLVQRWTMRLCEEIPGALAVFLVGSRLTGDAGPQSDLDFDVLVERAPTEESSGGFESENGRLLHVSVWIRELAEWLRAEHEPQDWAFGLAVSEQ